MKLIKLFGLVAIITSFTSCNTIIGMGRDIQQVGNTVGGGIKKGGDNVGEGLENKGYGKTWKGKPIN